MRPGRRLRCQLLAFQLKGGDGAALNRLESPRPSDLVIGVDEGVVDHLPASAAGTQVLNLLQAPLRERHPHLRLGVVIYRRHGPPDILDGPFHPVQFLAGHGRSRGRRHPSRADDRAQRHGGAHDSVAAASMSRSAQRDNHRGALLAQLAPAIKRGARLRIDELEPPPVTYRWLSESSPQIGGDPLRSLTVGQGHCPTQLRLQLRDRGYGEALVRGRTEGGQERGAHDCLIPTAGSIRHH